MSNFKDRKNPVTRNHTAFSGHYSARTSRYSQTQHQRCIKLRPAILPPQSFCKEALYYNHLPEHLRRQEPSYFKKQRTLWLKITLSNLKGRTHLHASLADPLPPTLSLRPRPPTPSPTTVTINHLKHLQHSQNIYQHSLNDYVIKVMKMVF